MVSQKTISVKGKEFDLIYKKGKSFSGRFFSLRILPQEDKEEETRFGIVISLKISKKAVIRNKKKRQLREIIRLNKDKIRSGYLCLVLTKKEIIDAKYDELEKEFIFLIKKAGLLD